MGTNFYMMTTDKELVHECFPDEYEIVEEPYLGYRIHIGKRSSGWRPLFEAHKKAYSSISEMIQFLVEHPSINIYDEYGTSYAIAQLKEELINWAANQEKRMIHYDDYTGEIKAPLDHVEMDQRDNRNPWLKIRYWHDKDGYNFTDRPFC